MGIGLCVFWHLFCGSRSGILDFTNIHDFHKGGFKQRISVCGQWTLTSSFRKMGLKTLKRVQPPKTYTHERKQKINSRRPV